MPHPQPRVGVVYHGRGLPYHRRWYHRLRDESDQDGVGLRRRHLLLRHIRGLRVPPPPDVRKSQAKTPCKAAERDGQQVARIREGLHGGI